MARLASCLTRPLSTKWARMCVRYDFDRCVYHCKCKIELEIIECDMYRRGSKLQYIPPPPILSYPRLDTIDLPCPKPLSSHANLSADLLDVGFLFPSFFSLFFFPSFFLLQVFFSFEVCEVHGLLHADLTLTTLDMNRIEYGGFFWVLLLYTNCLR